MALIFSTNNVRTGTGNGYALYLLYTLLTSAPSNGAGWTCVGSSNGTSGAMIDGYITSSTTMDATNSWMVLRSPIGKEFLIHVVSGVNTTIRYSKGGLFTGGINATPPTASDSLTVSSSLNTFYSSNIWHLCADSSYPYGFYVLGGGGPQTVAAGFFSYIPLDGYYNSYDDDPYVMLVLQSGVDLNTTANIALGPSPINNSPCCYTPNGTNTILICGNAICNSSRQIGFYKAGTQVPVFDLKFINYFGATYPVYKGITKFIRQFNNGRYNIPDRTLLGSNKEYVKIGQLVLPWDGSIIF